MPTLLHIDSSPLETSVSRELTREFVKTWKANHSGGTVVYRDLSVSTPAVLNANWIFAAHTALDSRTAEQKAVLALSDELIQELKTADEYVIGVAMHNFSVPSSLKLWIDQISRKGETFEYGEYGPAGLLKDKKATVLIATGGVYNVDSPAAAFDFTEPYLRTILGFLGVTDVTFVTAGGTAKLMSPAADREAFLKPTLDKVREVAA